MRSLKSGGRLLMTAWWGSFLAGAAFGQGKLVDVDPHPGILYCSNESTSMLCTDDAGATWHSIEYFRGRYGRAVMLSKGKATDETVTVGPAPAQTGTGTTPPVAAQPPGAHEAETKPPAAALPGGQPPLGPHEVVLGVQINGRPAGDFARLFQGDDGRLYVPADLIAQWRVQVFNGPSQSLNGQRYYALDAINGVRWQIDPQSQILSLTVLPSAFAPSALNASYREPIEASRPPLGLFLNHQLVYTRVDGNESLGGFFEAGMFSGLGVLTSQFAERDFTQSIAPIRLQTKLAREFPEHTAILNIGDSTSAVNTWSRQVTYAGVSWASDFATQPSYVPIVLPNLVGQAAQPSTVDIFVNGVRTTQQKVDPGPFTITNIPVITGQGDIQMVITDVLGRQQVITQSFISAQELLRPGVNAYTYESGILRRNFGIVSSQYGSLFAEAQQRHGFTERFTADARVEVSGQQQTASIGANYGINRLGIVGGGIALSHSGLGAGGLAYMVVQRRARRLGYSGTLQVATSTFQQLGLATGERAPKIQAQFQVTQAFGSRTTFALGYLRQENRTFLNNVQAPKPDFAGITTSVNVRIGKRLNLVAAANLSNSFNNASSATVGLVIPLGRREIVSATSTIQQNGSQLTSVEYERQAPIGTGYGYRLRSDVGDQSSERRLEGDLTVNTNTGSLEVEASQINSQLSTRFTETGSLVMLGGHVVPAPFLNTSFAVVEVPDRSGVRVFANNQYIATTSWRGLVVLPVLAPYTRNVVRLDDQSLPVDFGVDLGDKTIVPRSRTGVLVKFKAVRVNGATFQLVTEKGEPVPSNAEVTLGEFGTIYNTALRGEVYIPNISFPAHLHVHWADQRCDATIESADTREPLPHIGPVTCKAVR